MIKKFFKKLFGKKKKPADKPKDAGVKQASWRFTDKEGHDIHLCFTFYEGGAFGISKKIQLNYWNYTLNQGYEEILPIKFNRPQKYE